MPSRAPLDIDSAREIIKASARRYKQVDLLTTSFDQQRAFIADDARQVAALTSRQAGKSTAIGLKMIDYCLRTPNATCLYLALYRDTARDTMHPIFKRIQSQYGLGASFVIKFSPYRLEFTNGSEIRIRGLNDTQEEADKLRGQQFHIIAIDECAFMNTLDLENVIFDELDPCLTRFDGQLILIGTPGPLRNYFCDVTEGRLPDWSVHSWTTIDNPHMAVQETRKIARLKRAYPNIEENPGFQREHLGKWVIDDSKLMYRCTADNMIDELPVRTDWVYILAMDLGWNDSNAFVVGAYNPTDPTLYIVYSWSKPKMVMDQILAKIAEIKQSYNIATYVIDSSSKAYVEDMRYRTGIPFLPAEKIEKFKFRDLMNSDFQMLRIKVLKSCQSLVEEYQILTVDDRNPTKPKEVSSQDNHNADAALYLWRHSLHYNSKPTETEAHTDSMDQYWENQEAKLKSPDAAWDF